MSDKKYHRDRKVRDSRHEEDPRYKETYRRDSDMQSVRSSSCLSDDLCSPEYSSRSSSRRYDDLDVLSSRHSRQVAASLRSSRELDDDLYDVVGLGGCTRRPDSDVPLGQSRLSSDDLDGLEYPSGSSSLRHQLRSLEYSRERSHPDSASYRIHSTRSLSPLSDNRPPVDDSRILEYRGDKRVDHRSANSSRSFDDHIMEMEYSHSLIDSSLIDSHNKSSERDLFSPSRKYRDGSPSEKYRDSSSSRKYRESSSPRKYRDSSPSERYRDISPSRKYRESSSPRKYRDSSSPRRYRDSSPSERYPDRREYEENRRKLHYDENERTRVKPYDLTERRRAVRSGSFSPPLKKRVPDDVDCRQPDGRHDVQNSDRRVLYERGDEYSELDSNKERLLPDDYRKREEINLLKAKIKQMQEEKSLGGLRSDLDIAALAEALQPALMEEIANIEAMEQKADNTHTLKMMERETADLDPVRFEASARQKLISQPALRTMERDERNNDSPSRNELQPDLRYELISEFGESSNKMYTVQVTVDDRAFFGTGSTIQRAKREARKKALLEIVNLTSPDNSPTRGRNFTNSSQRMHTDREFDDQTAERFRFVRKDNVSTTFSDGNKIQTLVHTRSDIPLSHEPESQIDESLVRKGHHNASFLRNEFEKTSLAKTVDTSEDSRIGTHPMVDYGHLSSVNQYKPPLAVGESLDTPLQQTSSNFQVMQPQASGHINIPSEPIFSAPQVITQEASSQQISAPFPAVFSSALVPPQQSVDSQGFQSLNSGHPSPWMQQPIRNQTPTASVPPPQAFIRNQIPATPVPPPQAVITNALLPTPVPPPQAVGGQVFTPFQSRDLAAPQPWLEQPFGSQINSQVPVMVPGNQAMPQQAVCAPPPLMSLPSSQQITTQQSGKSEDMSVSTAAIHPKKHKASEDFVVPDAKKRKKDQLKENEKWELDLEVLSRLPLSRYVIDAVRTYALVELIETVKNHSTKLTLESLYQIFLRRCSQGMKDIVARDAQMFKHFLIGHGLIFRLLCSDSLVHMSMTFLKWNIVPLTSGVRRSSIDRIVNKVIMQRNGGKPLEQIQTNEKWQLNVDVLSQKPLLRYKTGDDNKTKVLVKLIETLKNSDTILSVKTLANIVFRDFTKEMKKVAGENDMGFKHFLSKHSILFYLRGSSVILLEKHLKWHIIPITINTSDGGSQKFEKWQLHMNIFNKKPLKCYGLQINQPKTQAVVKIIQILKEMNKAMDIPTLKVILFGVCSNKMKEAVGKNDQAVKNFIAKFNCLFSLKQGKVHLVDNYLEWRNETKTSVVGSTKFYKCELDTDVFLQKPLNSFYRLNLSDPGTQALVKIIQILKENNRPIHFATLTIMVFCEYTQEMKNAVGNTSHGVKRFLSKFGLLFKLQEGMVSLVEKHLRWKNLSMQNESSSKKDGSSSKQDESSSRKDESSSKKDEGSSVKNAGKKYILDIGSSLTSKVLACLPDPLALNVLVSTMEMLKNAQEPLGAEDWSKHFTSKYQENLFKTPRDFQEFLSKFSSLFNVADNVMQLKDEGLRWIEVPEQDREDKSKLPKQRSYQELTGRSDGKWELDLANSYMPKAYHKMSDRGARELVVVIIEELKRRKCVSYITNILHACILLNPWCTKRMKDALGSTQSDYSLKTFLSMFPSLFSMTGLNVSLKDKCLNWKYYFDGMLTVKTSGFVDANRKAIMYFRNRIYDVKKLLQKDGTIVVVSYSVFNTFLDSASDDIKICVGKLEDCWLDWLLKHPFIFHVETDKKMITLKEMVTPIVDNSLSLYFEDYRKIMLVRELLGLKGNLPFDELYDCFDGIRKMQKLFPHYKKNDFHSLITRNSDFFMIDSKEIVSVCGDSTPIVFISGVHPYGESDSEYIGHGKLKLVYDCWAVMDVGDTNIEDVYFDNTCFRSHIKSFRSCMEVGNWFSFSAFQVAGKKDVEMKWKSKWKASSIWTLHETCEQLGLKFKKIEENSPLSQKTKMSSDKRKTRSTKEGKDSENVVEIGNRSPANKTIVKTLMQDEVIEIFDDDELNEKIPAKNVTNSSTSETSDRTDMESLRSPNTPNNGQHSSDKTSECDQKSHAQTVSTVLQPSNAKMIDVSSPSEIPNITVVAVDKKQSEEEVKQAESSSTKTTFDQGTQTLVTGDIFATKHILL